MNKTKTKTLADRLNSYLESNISECQHPLNMVVDTEDGTGSFCKKCRKWLDPIELNNTNLITAQAARIAELENENRRMTAALQLIARHYIDSYTIPELRQIAKDAVKGE